MLFNWNDRDWQKGKWPMWRVPCGQGMLEEEAINTSSSFHKVRNRRKAVPTWQQCGVQGFGMWLAGHHDMESAIPANYTGDLKCQASQFQGFLTPVFTNSSKENYHQSTTVSYLKLQEETSKAGLWIRAGSEEISLCTLIWISKLQNTHMCCGWFTHAC